MQHLKTLLLAASLSALILLILSMIKLSTQSNVRQSTIVEHLSKAYTHINNIGQAKDEYMYILQISKQTPIINETLQKQLTFRAEEIFRNEKYLLGIDKDKMVAELRGISQDDEADIVAYISNIDAWCKSVKDDTIDTYSISKEGNEKFFELQKIQRQIETIKRKYTGVHFSLLDVVLIGIPLLASILQLCGQISSLRNKPPKITNV